MDWDTLDYGAAAVLLGGAALVLFLMMAVVKRTGMRVIIGILILLGLALIWAQLAVGII